MLSSISAQSTFLIRTRALHQLQNAFSTAVNVKPQSQSAETSYIDVVAQEWQTAKPFNQLPGLTKFQLMRGFMKGANQLTLCKYCDPLSQPFGCACRIEDTYSLWDGSELQSEGGGFSWQFSGVSLNELMLTLRKRYGDTYVLPSLFGQPAMVISFNVEDFEKVHRTEGIWPARPGGDALIHYRENRKDAFFKDWQGLMVSGEKWAKFRTAVNPVLMQPRNARLYLDPMYRVNEQFLARIRELRDQSTLEVPGNFIDTINFLTFESIAVVALDKELGLLKPNPRSPELQVLFHSVQSFIKSFYDLTIKPSLWKYIPTPTYRRFKNNMDTIFDITSKLVAEALERIEAQPEHVEGRSVLEKLVKIDPKIAMIMAMDMLMVGVDTTSSIITGIMLCIAKNPEKQAKLREEILAVVSNKNDKLTIENMKNLPYLKACIKEAMRIYPINFGNTRETGTDIALNGYQIPKGTRVFMNSNLLLTEERFYPRPLEFIPERWLRSSEAGSGADEKLVADNLSPFIYLPFGFGPRTCAGKRIVDLELELTLANLVRNFQIEFNYPTENAFKSYFINFPVIPLKFKFTELNY